jgi:hypothetical protein
MLCFSSYITNAIHISNAASASQTLLAKDNATIIYIHYLYMNGTVEIMGFMSDFPLLNINR